MPRRAFLCFSLCPHQGNLPGVTRQLVGSLQAEGKIPQRRMPDNPPQRLQSDAPLTDTCVPVLAGACGVLAVVKVDGFQAVQTNHPVKLCQHTVQIVDNIISAVRDMANR